MINALARIGLGTAQFGARYGISNRVGQPNEVEIAAILERAVGAGIGYLDTAAGYGDAETLIGRHLPHGHGLRIVTKLPAIAAETIDARHAAAACDGVAAALDRLKIDRLYGVLVHQVHDLAKPGWQHLVQALQECRARGWVTRIGASVYDEGELALVGGRFSPDLIQLPFNALDRRLCASGALDRIAAQGTEVHARSVFLQGLILMEPGEIPSHFAALRGQLTELHASWEARGLSPLAGCLRFVLQRRGISVAVVGVNQSSELEEIFAVVEHMADPHDIAATHAIRAADTLAATAGAPAVTPDSGAAIDAIDARYVDPRKWSGT